MLLPSFYTPFFGDGFTIAVVAITHVILSHGFAIGMMTLVVLCEYLAVRRKDTDLLHVSKRMLKISVIIITAVGAVTGAGIWFTVSAIAPEGTGSLLRVFFWPWFIEWLAFTTEVIVILPYYFLWDRMVEQRPHWHIMIGLFYIVSAFLSGFLITGILGFMLTPDGWVQNHKLLSAFFNPTFWPQLGLRYFGAQALGGLFFLLILLLGKDAAKSIKEWLLGFLSWWILITAAIAAGCVWLYFRAVPQTYATHKIFALLGSKYSQQTGILIAANLAVVAGLIIIIALAFLKRARAVKLLIIPVLILTLGLIGEFERTREFIRGPYLMPGYMYSNQITLEKSALMQQQGFVNNTSWLPKPPADKTGYDPVGYGLFQTNCGICHTIGGINDIRLRVKGRTLEGINVLIQNTNEMVPFMVPFSGNKADRLRLAAFLHDISAPKKQKTSK